MFQVLDLRAVDDLKLLAFPETEIIFCTGLIIIESNKQSHTWDREKDHISTMRIKNKLKHTFILERDNNIVSTRNEKAILVCGCFQTDQMTFKTCN